jgi:hypothetical protein
MQMHPNLVLNQTKLQIFETIRPTSEILSNINKN